MTGSPAAGPTAISPFLDGNYAPIAEERTCRELTVSGRLPAALSGRYLRTGPNPLAAPSPPHHWFLGDGMIHSIALDGGRAREYRNRWVRVDAVADALGEARRGGPTQPMYDSSNTNVAAFGGRVLSFTEGCYPYLLDDALDTLGRVDFGEPLLHGMTAHPKVDPVTGELHAFSYWWVEPYLLYHRISADGQLVETVAIDLPAPVSMHDFAITEGHIVFFDQPAVFNLQAAVETGFPFRWAPDNGARVGLLPRGAGADAIRWIDAPLGYSFHPMNAYEVDDTLQVDVPLTSSAYAGDRLGPGDDDWLGLQRWSIDLTTGRLDVELIDELAQEFCRVRDDRIGRPQRFGYTIELGRDMPYDGTRVFKQDLVAGTRSEHDFGPANHPGEFVFVADPDRPGDEDGGWLLGVVHPDGEERAVLTVLDAQDVAAAPVAEVHIPVRVPYGFHGNWVPDA